MDIALHTHTENPSLALRELQRWDDPPPVPASWRATLVLRCGSFTAELPFYFDQYILDRFLADLRRMDSSLTGDAVLATPNEDPFVKLSVGAAGGVTVTGLLLDNAHDSQRLEFAFRTDQTVLRPLVRDFEAAQKALTAGVAGT